MARLNPESQFKLIILGLVATTLGIFGGMYIISGQKEKIIESKTKIAETKRDLALLDNITQDINRNRGIIEKIKTTLPGQYHEVSFFVGQLERLAQNNNLTLEVNMEPVKKDERANYESVAYSMLINGSYSDVANFLTQISKLAYHTSVDQVTMSNDGGPLVTRVKSRLFIEKI
jgi:Tfp pilus assembly protein PilO